MRTRCVCASFKPTVNGETKRHGRRRGLRPAAPLQRRVACRSTKLLSSSFGRVCCPRLTPAPLSATTSPNQHAPGRRGPPPPSRGGRRPARSRPPRDVRSGRGPPAVLAAHGDPRRAGAAGPPGRGPEGPKWSRVGLAGPHRGGHGRGLSGGGVGGDTTCGGIWLTPPPQPPSQVSKQCCVPCLAPRHDLSFYCPTEDYYGTPPVWIPAPRPPHTACPCKKNRVEM